MDRNTLENKVALYLFCCRVSVFIVFLAWTLDKLLHPKHGVGVADKFFFIGGVSETAMFLFGVFELIVCILFVLGFYKRATRAFFLVISIFSVFAPQVLGGYLEVVTGGERFDSAIFFFTGFCLLACTISVYTLRDYDTRFTLGKADIENQ